MSQQNAGHAVEDIYRGVIADVINQVREAFYDDNIDVEILQQLKKSWENKINASGVVDLDGTKTVQPPPARAPPRPQNVAVNRISSAPNVAMPQNAQNPAIANPQPMVVLQQGGQQVLQPMPVQMQNNPNLRYVQAVNQVGVARSQGVEGLPQNTYRLMQGAGSTPYLVQSAGGGVQNVVLIQGNQQFTLGAGQQMALNLGNAQQLNLSGLPGGHQIVHTVRPDQPRMMAPTKADPGAHIRQLDGASGLGSEDTSTSLSIKQQSRAQTDEKFHKRLKNAKIAQLDGGPGMEDDSSSEDDEEDDDDPLRRFVGMEDTADDDEVVEEDPLNSEDDQSDDEDLDTLFDAENVVVCQFEKVHRARSKWKFTLKDGVMHIKGKDYCFQKCNGEAEW